jgi:multidrug efflux pump subunit AcrB
VNISARFIEWPIATGLLMTAIVLLGALSYRLLPVAALPNIDSPTIQVIAQLPGADPETMVSSVATPLERQFCQIPGLNQMTSSSALGYTQITLQFDRNRTVDSAAQDVQAAINATGGELPTNLLNPPIYRKVNPADTPILLIAMTSDALPLTKVSDYANSILAQKLPQTPGVGLVSVSGAQNPAIRVQVNPALLAAEGLDLETVRAALSTSTVNQPKGVLYGGQHAYSLLTNDQLTTADAFSEFIIAYRSGAPIRVGDIGRDRRSGGHDACRLAQRQARSADPDPAPARRQRHRDRRRDQARSAATSGVPAAFDQSRDRVRSNPDDPGQRR